MTVRSKAMIPMDVEGYNSVLSEYREALNWKINYQMDMIAGNRAAAAERDAANLRKKSNTAG